MNPRDPARNTAAASANDPLRAGIATYRAGDYARAAAYFHAALAADPGHRAARINLANALWSLGDYAAAGREADAARTADPTSAEAWIITGAIRLDGDDARGATAAYSQALRLRPGHAGAQAGLAAALLAEGHAEAAAGAAETALQFTPGDPHALFTLASAKLRQKWPAEALTLFDRLIAANPGHARARHNRAHALIDLGRLDEARIELHASLEHDPELKHAWATLGYLLTLEGELPAAIAACERAIALDPDFAVAQWNRGVALLLGGDFAGGFAAYEWRKRHPVFRHHFTAMPGTPWQGQPLAGKHLLIRAEQGFGDTIMLARFLPRLAAVAESLTLSCPPPLFPLFRETGGAFAGITLLPLNAPAGLPDYAVDQMSLPHILAVTEENIPLASGYLRPDHARQRAIAATLPPGPRIGVVWAGNPGHDNDHHRSLPPGALAPLLALPGLAFISLQIGSRAGEYAIFDAAPLIRDYADTAALVASLSAVVTVDTSVAHLAGALGIPCHVLLSKACDWRWRLGRTSTPWYTSLTLHRQEKLDDWSLPLASAMGRLRRIAVQ